MEKIKVGKIVNVVGIRGELKVYHYSDYKERFEELSTIYIDDIPYKIINVRYMKEMVILKLEGIDNRNKAEDLKDKDIYFAKEDARILPEDTYYIHDLIGLDVVDENGFRLGRLSDVIQNRAQDLYEIERDNRSKFLIPAVEEFILEIDMKNRLVKVKLIDGLLDL